MKNPKSNYIGEARRIRRTRMIIRGIIAGVIVLVVAFALFFAYILNLKDDIDTEFSASSDTTGMFSSSGNTATSAEDSSSGSDEPRPGESSDTDVTTRPEDTTETGTADTSDPDATSDPEGGEGSETTDEVLPIDTNHTEEDPDATGDDAAATTTVNLLPDEWEEKEPVLFPQKYPLQTVTHAERDQAYANLKHAVKNFIAENTDARIGFYYINLNTNEAFGYNESSPFVVGSSIYLPLTMMFYDNVRAGITSTEIVVAFSPAYVDENTRTSLAEMPEGKQFYLDQLAYLALSDGDSVAMNMLLDNMGDMDKIWENLRQMTSCIDFTAVQNYVDFQGIQQSGEHRSSAYDLASYAQKLYWRYISWPSDYQEIVDALGASDHSSGIGKYFPDDTVILSRSGSNAELSSESDVSIVLSDEPVVICVTVEAATPEAAKEIQAALGALVYNFISYCHT
ncbi:MAG: serine hydrolase [Clostridiales bacterium]|nr:serine hydrolase [Clostridiales bacterium]